LQQGNYTAARAAANDVENSGHSLSNKYADAFNHDSDQSEDVFAIQITKQTGDNLPIIMLRKTMEVAVVISKSEITILINSQTQMMRDVF
jgi:hypothetical protein